MKRTLLILLVALAVYTPSLAQKGKDKKKEEEKVPVYNYVIDDPMDVFGRQPVPENVVKNVLLPEFYTRGEKHINDTVLKYECYDATNQIILPDTLTDYKTLRYLSLIKTYPDPIQKYKDANGTLQPLPIQKIVYRYDKVGSDKWLTVDYANNKQATFQEHTTNIVRTDTASISMLPAGNYTITICKYYKVSSTK